MNPLNKPCSCGSGKKYKKCCLNKRKPRTTHVTVDMGRPTAVNGLFVDPKSGLVKFLHDGKEVTPVSSRIETGYERKKGLKILNRAPLPNDELVASPDIALDNYHILLAIDTNTETIRNNKVSVSGIASAKPIKILSQTVFKITGVNAIAFWNIKGKPENIAWGQTIRDLMLSPNYKPEIKIGLIVDSDLGNIPKYNSGELPIFSFIHLPKNMQLIYASSDSGKEFIGNRLLSLADKEAKKILTTLKEEEDYSDAIKVDGEPYTHYRAWHIST